MSASASLASSAPSGPSVASVPSWFDSSERRSLLLAAAHAWVGTPFFPNSEACGRAGGVDCVHLLNAIYAALGVIPRQAIPRQVMDHGQHSARPLLLAAFDTWPDLVARFVCVYRQTAPADSSSVIRHPAFAPLPGDALCFLAGKIPHHGGLMLTPTEFLHTYAPAGVHRMGFHTAVRGFRILGRLAAVYRPLPDLRPSLPSSLRETSSS